MYTIVIVLILADSTCENNNAIWHKMLIHFLCVARAGIVGRDVMRYRTLVR